jgi:hypothetical protein
MNARLKLHGIGNSHLGASSALLAWQWMRDRDYFTLQTKAPGAWLETGWRRRPGRTAPALLRLNGMRVVDRNGDVSYDRPNGRQS